MAKYVVSFALAITLVVGLSTDCQAQRTRGRLLRPTRQLETARTSHLDQVAVGSHSSDSPIATPAPEMKYQSDWRRDPAFNFGTPQYPKYFGGFHYSQYYNLGIPNGDSGFRGNGIYWTPW